MGYGDDSIPHPHLRRFPVLRFGVFKIKRRTVAVQAVKSPSANDCSKPPTISCCSETMKGRVPWAYSSNIQVTEVMHELRVHLETYQ